MSDTMLHSYDIFDTILFRKVPRSTDVFLLMDEKLGELWETKYGLFSEVRRKSEFWLRRTSSKEISIEDIYKRIQKKTNLSDIDVDQIAKIELNTEKEHSVLNSPIVDEIKKILEGGEKVVLISDMYWHEKQIRAWLSEKDEVFSALPIYISCDYGVTKKSGKLYEVVRDKENDDYTHWTHTGDNEKSDGEAAKGLGINEKIIKGGRKYDFEEQLDISNKNIFETYGVITETVAESNGSAFDLGASIVAPMVYQYVSWVIEEAIKRNINTLYFVLRDGYILKQVADVIIEQKHLLIRTKYIFGSRVAWRFPEITIEKLKNLSVWDKSNWIFRDPSVAYVPLERIGFKKEKVDQLLGANFGSQELYSFAEFKTMLDKCLIDEEFVNILQTKISEARSLVAQYFKEIIDFNESFALVDTNSTGKTQEDLNRMLKSIDSEFVGLRFFYHTFLAEREPDNNTQFVFINSNKTDRRFPEAFFRAPYNQCYGYQKIDGKTVPRLHESDKCAWNYSFDYDSYLSGIVSFAKRADEINVDEYVELLLKVVNFEILSRDEISQVAKMPFNPDLNGNEVLDFYPELKGAALLHPFSELIYYPKGSYYNAGGIWPMVYDVLYSVVTVKRQIKKARESRDS